MALARSRVARARRAVGGGMAAVMMARSRNLVEAGPPARRGRPAQALPANVAHPRAKINPNLRASLGGAAAAARVDALRGLCQDCSLNGCFASANAGDRQSGMSQLETAQRHLTRALRRLEAALEQRLARPADGVGGADRRRSPQSRPSTTSWRATSRVLREQCDRLSVALSEAQHDNRTLREVNGRSRGGSTARSPSSIACSGAEAMPMVEITRQRAPAHGAVRRGRGGRVRQLASYVDRRVADLARGQTQVGDARLLLMASLMVADELSDAFDEIKRLRGRARGARRRRASIARPAAVEQVAPAARRYCGAAGERLTKPGAGAARCVRSSKTLGPIFSVRELSLPGPWSRHYGAHLRRQATEESSDRRPWRPRTPVVIELCERGPPIADPAEPGPAQGGAAGRAAGAARRGDAAGRLRPRHAVAERLRASFGCRPRRRSSPATGRSQASSTRGRAAAPRRARPSARAAAHAGRGRAARLPRLGLGRAADPRRLRRSCSPTRARRW